MKQFRYLLLALPLLGGCYPKSAILRAKTDATSACEKNYQDGIDFRDKAIEHRDDQIVQLQAKYDILVTELKARNNRLQLFNQLNADGSLRNSTPCYTDPTSKNCQDKALRDFMLHGLRKGS